MIFNVVLRFFDSTLKFSRLWDSNPWFLNVYSDALPIEITNLTWHIDHLAQPMSTLEVWHESAQTCAWLSEAVKVQAPSKVTLYLLFHTFSSVSMVTFWTCNCQLGCFWLILHQKRLTTFNRKTKIIGNFKKHFNVTWCNRNSSNLHLF